MNSVTNSHKLRISLLSAIVLVFGVMLTSSAFSQPKRNPVLEFCTGAWCQWCPCGDSLIVNDVLPNIPNAIVLAYHGPANVSADPFSFFTGNAIISSMEFTGYPTGVVGRATGIISRSAWLSELNKRLSLPPTVNIEMESQVYNRDTRQYSATIKFTALQTITDQFKFNAILVEDGPVYAQSSNNVCTPGTNRVSDYVHDWLVRDMMNGTMGENVNSGSWSQGVTMTKTVNYTIPVPPQPAPDVVPDSC